MGDELKQSLSELDSVQGWQSPNIFDPNTEEDAKQLQLLIASGKVSNVSNNIDEAIEELYHIDNPSQIDALDQQAFQKYKSNFGQGNTNNYGKWVFYPWSGNLTHFPSPDDLGRLRGSRNRNLITEEERLKLAADKTILILGLSVGSNAVDSLLMQGIGSKYVLVDMDTLAPTNLNRIRAAYDQVGVHKVDVVAKKISELDPFITQIHYKDGLTIENLEEILAEHKPNIIIDEMDSLNLKLQVRLRARQLGLPVIMATDDGDDILLDIERYDQDSQQPILHNIMPQPVIDSILANKQMSRQEMGAIIGKYFVNLENVPLRMLESLTQVGRTLPSWPQLGGAAVLSGLYLAYAARRILLDQPLNSGRFLMGPEQQLNPEIQSEAYKSKKAELIKMLSGPAN